MKIIIEGFDGIDVAEEFYKWFENQGEQEFYNWCEAVGTEYKFHSVDCSFKPVSTTKSLTFKVKSS